MRVRRALIVLSFALLWSAAPARAAIITFESQTVDVGDIITVDILLNDAEGVGGFAFDLVFDSDVVGFASVTGGIFSDPAAYCCFFAGTAEPDRIVGINNVFFTVLGDPLSVSGSGVLLATITFNALAEGDAGIEFQLAGLLDAAFNPIEPTIETENSILVGQVDSVPEPSTLGLMALGLAALARRRLRA